MKVAVFLALAGLYLSLFSNAEIALAFPADQLTPIWHDQTQSQGYSWPSVALGAFGSQLTSNPNGGSGAVKLYTAGSVTKSSPEIWHQDTGANSVAGVVAASAKSNLYISFYLAAEASGPIVTPTLVARRSPSSNPIWTVQPGTTFTASLATKPLGAFVKEDGSRVVVWWLDIAQQKIFFKGYSGENGSLLFSTYVNSGGPPAGVAVDPNMRRLVMSFSTVALVLNCITGVFEPNLNVYTTTAVALSLNGDTAAIAMGSPSIIAVYQANASGFLQYKYTISTEANYTPHIVSLSRDGSTLATWSRNYNNLSNGNLTIHNLGATATQSHIAYFQGLGAYTVIFTDLATSADGSSVIAATSGDQNHLFPSLLLYRRIDSITNTYALADSEVLSGTVTDIDLSHDDTTLAVSGYANHYQAGTTFKTVDLFRIGGEMHMVGVPHAGGVIELQQQATPGSTNLLLVSESLASAPVAVANFGNLLLLQNPTRLFTAIAGADGIAHFNLPLPSGPAEFGKMYHFQGAQFGNRKFSNNAQTVTINP